MDINDIFSKYGITFDNYSPESSIRKLLGFLHPDKNKNKADQAERELDYKKVTKAFKGTRSRKSKKGSKSSKRKSSKRKSSKSKSICWKGYHRVKGTQPYSKHSCVKNK
jgi:hypothetical protein